MTYCLIFLAVMVEGPFATLAFAALAAQDPSTHVYLVFLAAMLGNFVADACWYTLGGLGKHGKVLQFIPWLRNQNGLIKRASREMRRRGVKVFILTKFGFGLGSIPLLIAAGMLHINRKKLILAAIGSELCWTGALTTIGYQAASHLNEITAFIHHTIPWVAGIMITGALIYLIKHLKITS